MQLEQVRMDPMKNFIKMKKYVGIVVVLFAYFSG